MLNFKHSKAILKRVKEVQFGVLSPDEIKKGSVCLVNDPGFYKHDGSGEAISGGLADPSMGPVDRYTPCATCGCRDIDCPGHFGHIELAKPVYHPGYLNVVIKVLRCVCWFCGSLLLSKDVPKLVEQLRRLPTNKRLHRAAELGKTRKQCTACRNPVPIFRKDGISINMTVRERDEATERIVDGDRKEATAEMALEVLRKIKDEDCELIGLNAQYGRPDWLILQVLPVPPQPVRPSIDMGGTARAEDDLSYALGSIVKANKYLSKLEADGAPQLAVLDFWRLLAFHVATYFDNELPSVERAKQRGGRELKSITQRLKGKEGRVRGNLMGKRVDFSARTVITGDPNLSIEQVGVPLSIAMNLTYPEVVTHFNLEELRKLVQRGPTEHPGANYVWRADGMRFDLRHISRPSDVTLSPGYIVERHLQDGDLVVFNRQPSLHKMSMMGHRVKVLNFSTFRMNLSVTTPYNADFDGDEMNLHVPQTLETRSEVANLMMVPLQIVTPKDNRPVISIVQDALLACSLFTQRDVFLTRAEVMNILMWLDDWDGRVPMPAIVKAVDSEGRNRGPLWTGKQLFSMVIPNVNMAMNCKRFKDDVEKGHDISPADTRVVIEQGVLLCGILDKKSLGSSAGSLIHIIQNEQGPVGTRMFLDQIQKIVNFWMLHRGYTIGVGDTIADEQVVSDIAILLDDAKNKVTELIKQARNGLLKAKPGQTLRETLEQDVNKQLNKATEDCGKKVQDNLTERNNIVTMVLGGSKGNETNLAQIIATVGQQNVMGKRIPFGFVKRTLPHFPKYDLGSEARGFVSNSYLSGLTPQEFFFHAMGGREGLVDTAVKTAETGYIQRRLVKAMEDLMVKYDGTLRNSKGEVIQFCYGEDGMDATYVENQRLLTVTMSDADLEREFRFRVTDENVPLTPEVKNALPGDEVFAEEFRQIMLDRAELRKILPAGNNDVVLPVNVKRLIWNAQQIFNIDSFGLSDLPPAQLIDARNKLETMLEVVPGRCPISRDAQQNATLLFKIHLRSILSCKQVIYKHRLNVESFLWLLAEVRERFLKALVQPGEMVGAIAAQSLGEPATQMTLNTFHYAGVSAMNVTLGVPRLKEIINVAATNRTPGMTVYLNSEYSQDEDQALLLQSKMEYTTVRQVATRTEIYYDPVPNDTIIDEDRQFVSDFFELEGAEDEDYNRFSPWMLRIEFDRQKMRAKQMELSYIAAALYHVWAGNLHCVFSPENADKLVMRLRLPREKSDDSAAEGNVLLQGLEKSILDTFYLCGIRGVRKVMRRKEMCKQLGYAKYKEDGSIHDAAEEWVLDTEGTNLLEALAQTGVDHTRTVSNNIIEIWKVLGIEAARAAILSEIRFVLRAYGLAVNYRHLSTLADVMTSKGFLLSITRHGINRTDKGPLMRSSFEETVEILMDAACYSTTDDLKGVTQNVMLGQTAPVGTGYFDLFLDEEALKGVVPMSTQAPSALPVGAPIPQTPFGMSPGISPAATPYMVSPKMTAAGMSPGYNTDFHFKASPMASPGGGFSSPMYQSSPMYASSPGFSSPAYGSGPIQSPLYGASPGFSPASPGFAGGSSPMYSPASPGFASPASPAYSPSSPAGVGGAYSPSSPAYSPSSPAYSPSSPAYSPSSPAYSPSSPAYSPSSPAYSPSSPAYSPSSPAYSPSSPAYSPSSPAYSPSSPAYSPSSPAYSPSSPAYSPSSPAYSPSSPAYSPSSPTFVTSRHKLSQSYAYAHNMASLAAGGDTGTTLVSLSSGLPCRTRTKAAPLKIDSHLRLDGYVFKSDVLERSHRLAEKRRSFFWTEFPWAQ